MLKDRVTIKIKSGRGGRGSNAVNLKHLSGGDGGYGGNIYLKGSENVYDLASFDEGRTFSAERGEDGAKRRKSGSDGKDIILTVPILTEVHIGNRVPFKVTKHDEVIKVLKGGRGGFGNITLEKLQDDKLTNEGEEGRTKEISLVLKLQSDIIFVGYPNAGKSSLLNALAQSKYKVAPYAFTTLEPQLGLMDGIVLMDLPGLIEGTSEGKGLGKKFVKHTESCKMIAHIISLENEDPMALYKSLRKEIEAIDEKLAQKPEVIVLTKTDESNEKHINESIKKFEKAGFPTISCSAIDDASLFKVKEFFKKAIANIQ